MKITLETVREVLRKAFGYDSFIAGFITEVGEDCNIASVGIDPGGKMLYNPRFIWKHLTSPQDLFSLIFHELLHRMFGHFIYGTGDVENIAADSIINAIISGIYADESNKGALFKNLYKDNGIEGLLRPVSSMRGSIYQNLYESLYSVYHGHGKISTGEVITTLKVICPPEKIDNVELLGDHGSVITDSCFAKDTLGGIAEDIRNGIKNKCNNYCGFSPLLRNLLLEALKTHLSIKKQLLSKFLTRRRVDKFRAPKNVPRLTVSALPIAPSKRDLVMLSAGFHLGYFHKVGYRTKTDSDRGIAIYLDVSGSVHTYLPKIMGIIAKLRANVSSVYLFSNKVVETSMEKLTKGEVSTTYGTDFNCVAESILDNKFDKAVVITDGYAFLNRELSKTLEERKVEIMTILFGNSCRCEPLRPFGDVLLLEEVCE